MPEQKDQVETDWTDAWASDVDSDDTEKKDPFKVADEQLNTASRADDFLSGDTGEVTQGKLPVIVFDLEVHGAKYRITTADPIISETRFDSSAEIDLLLAKTTEFRLVVFEAQHSARSARKRAESEMQTWSGQARKAFLKSREGTKKPTLQEIEDHLKTAHKKMFDHYDLLIEAFKFEESRLEALYYNLNDRAKYLSGIAERYTKTAEVYRSVFSD